MSLSLIVPEIARLPAEPPSTASLSVPPVGQVVSTPVDEANRHNDELVFHVPDPPVAADVLASASQYNVAARVSRGEYRMKIPIANDAMRNLRGQMWTDNSTTSLACR